VIIFTSPISTLIGGHSRRTFALACVTAGALVCQAGAAVASGAPAVAGVRTGLGEVTKPIATAILQQCLTSGTQTARSATFQGEMTAVPGTARMEMRIEVLERVPGSPAYRKVIAPGLGVWRNSAPGVKTYTYLKQVTNLSAPAFYRGSVRFRWMNARGRLLKTTVLRTRRCEQPAVVAGETETPLPGAHSPGTTG
jgi:hypothetical protein